MVNNLDGFYAGYTKGMRAEILKFKNEVLHETLVRRMLDEEFSIVDEYVGISSTGRRIKKRKPHDPYEYLDMVEPTEEELRELA